MIQHTRRRHLIGLAALGGTLGVAGPAFAADIRDYVDTWSGTLVFGARTLRCKLVIAGETAARMYSVDQGGGEIRATTVELTPNSVTLAFASINGSFAGSLTGPNMLTGVYTFAAETVPVVFERGDLFPYEPLTPSLLSKTRQTSGAPAIGAAYASMGSRATILVDGLRSVEGTKTVQPGDIWCLGSVGKSMTATLAARLVEAGAIMWDTTIGDVLGASIPRMEDSYRRATLRNLLNHRAGLQRDLGVEDYATFARDGIEDARAERFRWAAIALKRTPLAAPGERMSYANNGYIVAGAMMEALCDQPWERLMRDHVYSPLNLRSGGFGPPGTAGKLDQPLGHWLPPATPAKLTPADLRPGKILSAPIAKGPAGRAHMTLADLITYLNAHLLRPAAFLKPETWDALHTPPPGGDYAMGWIVQDNGLLTHTGSDNLWCAHVAIDPKSGTVAAVTTNHGDAVKMRPHLGRLLQGALLSAQG